MQAIGGLGVLHVFGHHLGTAGPRHCHRRLHHRVVAVVAGEVAHERAVDLDDVHRHLLQPGKALHAYAEVVDGDAAPTRAQLLQQLIGLFGAEHGHRLADFKAEF